MSAQIYKPLLFHVKFYTVTPIIIDKAHRMNRVISSDRYWDNWPLRKGEQQKERNGFNAEFLFLFAKWLTHILVGIIIARFKTD